jgi:ABC-type transporter MlaC component
MPLARLRRSNPELVVSVSLSATFLSSNVSTKSPFATQSSSSPNANSAATSNTSANTAVQQFLEYAKMTPAERLHAQMLARLGLTEDQFKAMSPADQQKIEDKIREMIKQQVANGTNTPTGVITDKSV